MRARFLLTPLAVGGCGVFLACQWVAGVEERQVFTEDARADDAGAEFDSAPDPCRSSNLPAAPAGATSSDDDTLEGVFALSSVTFNTGPDGGVRAGVNLDERCTCPERDSCQRPSTGQTLPPKPACDGPGGVDNAAEPIVAALSTGKPTTEASINASIARGSAGLLIQIRRYNGLANDGQVDVAIYASQGFDNAADAGLMAQPDASVDGGVLWSIDRASVVSGVSRAPRYTTTSGYVVNDTLVATLKFPLIFGWVSGQPLIAELESGIIVAKLKRAGRAVTGLQGTLAGRWRVDSFLALMQFIPDPLDPNRRLCGDDATYVAFRPTVCNAADIASNPASDGTGRCDAISVGIAIEATAAALGAVKTTLVDGGPCGANYAPRCL